MKKLISIIIPVYKTEQYIKRCIESIVNQTYKHLEIILVDDGSPDNSGKICDEYAKQDDRIVVVHKENGGLSDARNRGIEIAKGDYIAFVDSDDYISLSMFENLIEIAVNEQADTVHFNFQMVDEEGKKVKCDISQYSNSKILDGRQMLKEHIVDYMAQVMAWNKLYKRKLFRELRFEKGYYYEDEMLFCEICKISNKNVIIPDVYYYYTNNPTSITKSKMNIQKVISKKYLIGYFEKFYKNDYPELHQHIYILICFICQYCIKELNYNKGDKNYLEYSRFFKDKYVESYKKMKSKKSPYKLPLKKKIYTYYIYLYLKNRR